jgi:mRNA-degrading endonuclease RelE of RelBE toxin-antitoxin system
MSSVPTSWELRVHKPARKSLAYAPRPERERLVAALEAMTVDPFAGDVQPSKGHPVAFRRRVGNWRIFFEADRAHRVVEITDIVRRTSTTYRKR